MSSCFLIASYMFYRTRFIFSSGDGRIKFFVGLGNGHL